MSTNSISPDSKRLYVEKIKKGTVIDHIKEGFAISVLKILGLDGRNGHLITIGINVKSNVSNSGRKDILKVENTYLDEKQIHQIALISPECKVSFIEDFQIKEKFVVKIPEIIKGIINCPNENCITNVEREPVLTEFKVLSEKPLKIACNYCERILYKEEILQMAEKN
ncbi:MAG: aspartate carbamoyltransferase regulatory subunit [Promethearchaeota archaeon]